MTGARISFGVYSPGAKDAVTFSASSKQPWSDLAELSDGIGGVEPSDTTVKKYMTGEPDMTRLDGTFHLFPTSPTESDHLAYWSAQQSADDGSYGTAPPTLTCTFSEAQSSLGVTLCFDVTTPLKAFKVDWYGADGALLDTVTVSDNAQSVASVEKHVDGYTKVDIVAISADPHRYVKLQEIEWGQRIVYESEELVTASLTEEVDLSGASAPAGSLQMTVLDPEGRLDPVNPAGIYDYLWRGLQVRVECMLDGVYYPRGVYYLDEWEGQNAGTAKMSAVDALGVEGAYESRLYESATPADILADYVEAIGIEGKAQGLPVASLTGYIPAGTAQDAAAHIALASGGVAVMQPDGSLAVQALSTEVTAELTEDEVLGQPSAYRISNPDTIEIEQHGYAIDNVEMGFLMQIPEAQGSGDNVRKLTLSPGAMLASVRLTTPGPAWDFGVYSDRVECLYSESDAGDAVGIKYHPAAQEDPDPVVVQGSAGTKLSVQGVPLITSENIDAVTAALQAYLGKTLRIKLRMVLRPDLLCGDRVSVPTRFGRAEGNIESINVDLTGGMIADVEVLV